MKNTKTKWIIFGGIIFILGICVGITLTNIYIIKKIASLVSIENSRNQISPNKKSSNSESTSKKEKSIVTYPLKPIIPTPEYFEQLGDITPYRGVSSKIIFHKVMQGPVYQELITRVQKEGETEKPQSFWIADIDLNEDRVEETIVFPEGLFIRGASGNGPIFIFQRSKKEFQCIGSLFGNAIAIEKMKTNGYHDILTHYHFSGDSGTIARYKWNLSTVRYEEVGSWDYHRNK